MVNPSPHLRDLFEAAADLEPGDRTAYLVRACAGEDQLLARVSQLLAIDESVADATLSPPTNALRKSADAAWNNAASTTNSPGRIGRYHIVERLGEGSAATVYRARQDHPDREVALKLLRAAPEESSLLTRFEREVQVLSQLDHPAIARVYDAWALLDNDAVRPYFAMQLIDGGTITEYCRRHDLTTEQKLELFCHVCDGVAYAHQKGIIHRDLKPDNILVDTDGKPKIVDFGIARITGSDVDAVTCWTGQGAIVGTIPYMSPEQLDSRSSDIDTLSDVYALGVILFELMTGKRPFDTSKMGLVEAARFVAETPLPAPRQHATDLHRDIETIIQTAASRDRTSRYQSVTAIADDIRRYLRHEPIAAGHRGAVYRASRFVRRHPLRVAAAVIGVAVVAATVLAFDASLDRSRRDRIRVEQQEKSVTALLKLFDKTIAKTAPDGANALIEARTFIDSLSASVDENAAAGDYDNAPLVEARLRERIAESYNLLRDNEVAIKNARRAGDLYAKHLGPGSDRAMTCRLHEGRSLLYSGKIADAEKVFADAHAATQASKDPNPLLQADLTAALANIYDKTGRSEEAIPLYELSMKAHRKAKGPDDRMAMSIQTALAMAQARAGRFEDALKNANIARAHFAKSDGVDQPASLNARYVITRTLIWSGRYDEAEEHFPEFIEHAVARFGEDHRTTNDFRNIYAQLLTLTDRAAEALPIYDRTLAAFEAEHPGVDRTLRCIIDRSICIDRLGRQTDAVKGLRRAIDGYQTEDPVSEQRLRAMIALITTLADLERNEDAQHVVAQADELIAARDRTDPRLLESLDGVRTRVH